MASKGRENVPPVHHQHSAQYTTAFPALAEVYLTPCPSVIPPQDSSGISHIEGSSAASSRRSSSGTRGVPRNFASAALPTEGLLSRPQSILADVALESGSVASTGTLRTEQPKQAGESAAATEAQSASQVLLSKNGSRVVIALQHAPCEETTSGGGESRGPSLLRSRSTPRLGLAVPPPPSQQQGQPGTASSRFAAAAAGLKAAAVGSSLSPTTPPTSASASSSARSLRGGGLGSPRPSGAGVSRLLQTLPPSRAAAAGAGLLSPTKRAAAAASAADSSRDAPLKLSRPLLAVPATRGPLQPKRSPPPPLGAAGAPSSPVAAREDSRAATTSLPTQESAPPFKSCKQRSLPPFAPCGVLRPSVGALPNAPQENPVAVRAGAFWAAGSAFGRGPGLALSFRTSGEGSAAASRGNGGGLRGSASSHQQHPLARLCLQPVGDNNAFRPIFRGGPREGQRQRVAGVDMWRFSDGCISPRIEGTALYVYLQQHPEGLAALERALMGCILFLYEEGIKPFAGEIAHQMRKRADAGTWVPCEVLALAMACKDLSPRIERRVKGEDGWVLLLKPHVEPANFQGFIDTRASENLYSQEQWLHFNRYFIDKLREGASGLSCFSAGRYALAERLRQEVPFFRRCRLAHLIRMIQLASWRRVLTYREKALIPVAACPLAARDFLQRHFPDPSGARAAAHAHSISQLLKTLRKVVNSEPLGVFLAQLKDLVRASSHGRIDAGLLGHAKLQDLLLAEPFSRFYRLYTPSASEHCTFVQSKQYALPEGAILHTKAAASWGSLECPMEGLGTDLNAWGPDDASVWNFKVLVPIACSCAASLGGGVLSRPSRGAGALRSAHQQPQPACVCQGLLSGSGAACSLSSASRLSPPRDNPWTRRPRKEQTDLSTAVAAPSCLPSSRLQTPAAAAHAPDFASPPKTQPTKLQVQEGYLLLSLTGGPRGSEILPFSSGTSTAHSLGEDALSQVCLTTNAAGETQAFALDPATSALHAAATANGTSPPPPAGACGAFSEVGHSDNSSSRDEGRRAGVGSVHATPLSPETPSQLPHALASLREGLLAADVEEECSVSEARPLHDAPQKPQPDAPALLTVSRSHTGATPRSVSASPLGRKSQDSVERRAFPSPVHGLSADLAVRPPASPSSTIPEDATDECSSSAPPPKKGGEQTGCLQLHLSVHSTPDLLDEQQRKAPVLPFQHLEPRLSKTAGEAFGGDGCEALTSRPSRPLRSSRPQAAFRRSLSVSRVEGFNKRLAGTSATKGEGGFEEAGFVAHPNEKASEHRAETEDPKASTSPPSTRPFSSASFRQSPGAAEAPFKKQVLCKAQLAASAGICAHQKGEPAFEGALVRSQEGALVKGLKTPLAEAVSAVPRISFSSGECRCEEQGQLEKRVGAAPPEEFSRRTQQLLSVKSARIHPELGPPPLGNQAHQLEGSASRQSLGFSTAVAALYSAENWALHESLSESDKTLEPPLQFLLHRRSSPPTVPPAVFAVQHSEG